MAMQAQKITTREIRGLIVFGVLFAAAVYLSIQFIAEILGIIILFSLVALIVLVLTPGVGWLERHGLPRPVSAGFIALLALTTVCVIGWLVIPPAARETKDLAHHLPGYIAKSQRWLADKGGAIGAGAGSVNPTRLTEMLYTKTGPILSRIGSYAVNAATLIVSAFVVFISVIYTLASPRPAGRGSAAVVRSGEERACRGCDGEDSAADASLGDGNGCRNDAHICAHLDSARSDPARAVCIPLLDHRRPARNRPDHRADSLRRTSDSGNAVR